MTEATRARDRRSGTLLVAFVAVQVVYLIVQLGWMAPPRLSFDDVPALAAFTARSGVALRTHTLITLSAFVFLFVPGTLGLRKRLARSTPEGSAWPDLMEIGALLVLVSVFMATVTYADMGAPGALSDSTLRASLMDNNYSVMVLGSFAIALFVGATSMAVLRLDGPVRWLGWWGLVTVDASVVGTLWIFTADLNGALFALSLAARASFLAWLVATGIWLLRSDPAASGSGAEHLLRHVPES